MLIAALALLLLFPSSASAYLTAAEYTSIAALLTVNENITSALIAMGGTPSDTTLIESSTTTNRAHFRDAWTAIAESRVPFARAVAYLWNVNPDTDGAACGANRAACVASAVTEVANLNTKLTTAHARLTDLASVTGCGGGVCGDAAYRTRATAGVTALNTALGALASTWNPALTYTDPWNDWYKKCLAVGVTGCVLGPHGRLNKAVFASVQAATASSEGELAFKNAWDWVANGETIASAAELAAFGRIIFRGAALTAKVLSAPLRYNLISATPTRSPFTDLSKFYEHLFSNHSASQARGHDIEGFPYHDDQAGADTMSVASGDLVTYGSTRSTQTRTYLSTGYHKLLTKMWARSDGSGWRSMELPSAANRALIRANRSQMNDPHGPPINYYKE